MFIGYVIKISHNTFIDYTFNVSCFIACVTGCSVIKVGSVTININLQCAYLLIGSSFSESSARQSYLHGDYGRKCPSPDVAKEDCPVHYALNHDVTRIPVNLVHARCNCHSCVHNHSFKNACHPVYVHTPVLRRDVETCEYFPALEQVPVACECDTRVHYASKTDIILTPWLR